MKKWSRKHGARSGKYIDCLHCGKRVYRLPKDIKRGWSKFCSHSCRAKSYYPRNIKAFSGGDIARKAGAKALSKFNQLVRSDETKSPSWKGAKVQYGGLHEWIVRRRGKPICCEMCGTKDPNEHYEWANINHEYRRDLNDYRRMCVPCHRIYDFKAAKERRKLNGTSKIDFVPKT